MQQRSFSKSKIVQEVFTYSWESWWGSPPQHNKSPPQHNKNLFWRKIMDISLKVVVSPPWHNSFEGSYLKVHHSIMVFRKKGEKVHHTIIVVRHSIIKMVKSVNIFYKVLKIGHIILVIQHRM